MLKKIIFLAIPVVCIFGLASIGYSAEQNGKVALTSKMLDTKILENFSTQDTQLIRKVFSQEYEKFIFEYYQKNWNDLSGEQKKIFLGIGIKTKVDMKLQKLDPEALNYIEEFEENEKRKSLEMKRSSPFFLQAKMITKITENFIQKLSFFITNNDENLDIGIDINKSRQLLT
jgi:hypothetical protein